MTTTTRQTFTTQSMKGLIEIFSDKSAKIKVRITHPMTSGIKTASERHFIENFTCELNGKTIFHAELFAGISTNPPLFFKVVRLSRHDELKLSWQDNLNNSETTNITIN